mgnify:CR=1 FL=1
MIFAFQRLILWFDNPNKAAVLFACLALIALSGILKARRRSLVALAWALFVLCGGGLALTLSRGGLVACLLGALTFAIPLGSARRRLLALSAVAVLTLAFAAAVCLAPQRQRLLNPGGDGSIANRLLIWRTAPCMMADAPSGWGLGQAGTAFMSWYQPLDRHEEYRTLVSTHLTLLAELGRPGRLALASAWLFALGLGLLHLLRKADALPLALTSCLCVAALFSSVGEAYELWILPGIGLVITLRTFFSEAVRPWRKPLVTTALIGGTALVAGLEALGRHIRPADLMSLTHSANQIVLGITAPDRWIAFDPSTMGGPAYGRTLRRYAAAHPHQAFGVARTPERIPADIRHLALCGATADIDPALLKTFTRLQTLRVLSPVDPEKWLNVKAEDGPDIRVYCGEFAPNCPRNERPGLTIVPGNAAYLTAWPAYAFD